MRIIEDAAGITLREVIPRVIPVAAPATGAEFTIPVQSGSLWYVESVRYQLVTSAVAGNRAPNLLLDDGSSVFGTVGASVLQAASLTQVYSLFRTYGQSNNVSALGESSSFPSIPLFGGFRIRSSTASIDAGDQYSAIVIYVLEVEERSYDVELGMDAATLRGQFSNAFPEIPLGS